MLDDFLVRAALAALGTALAAGLLGCFVVWRRMAYFGDAAAHAAVLGVAVALAFSVNILTGVALVALLMALLFFLIEGKGHSSDAVLGVLSHGALGLGLMAMALLPGSRVNLESYLFGEVLTVSKSDVGLIWLGAVAIVATLVWQWRDLLTATISPDLAYAAGIDPRRKHLLLTFLTAGVVAVAIKVVGALLITALLIIPAAAARNLTRTPEAMAVAAVVIGAISALGGLRAALMLDTPVGPTVVCLAFGCFVITLIAAQLQRMRT